MYVDVQDCAEMCKQWKTRVSLQYNECLTILNFSQQLQWVWMVISYMPNVEDGYHLLAIARESLSRSVEGQEWNPEQSESLADFSYEGVKFDSEAWIVW